MYKKITHTIVEEHFDDQESVTLADEIKNTWKAPLRYYPDGQQIASGLPSSYERSVGNNRCGNCKAYNPSTSVCMNWLQPVRLEYVCSNWTAI